MSPQISPSAKAIGFWSAVLATVFSLICFVIYLAEWLGTQGGAESASIVLGLVLLLTPSLFLGSSLKMKLKERQTL